MKVIGALFLAAALTTSIVVITDCYLLQKQHDSYKKALSVHTIDEVRITVTKKPKLNHRDNAYQLAKHIFLSIDCYFREQFAFLYLSEESDTIPCLTDSKSTMALRELKRAKGTLQNQEVHQISENQAISGVAKPEDGNTGHAEHKLLNGPFQTLMEEYQKNSEKSPQYVNLGTYLAPWRDAGRIT